MERLTLLTIITFGETIVDISGYFEPSRFSVLSVLIFLIVATLYFCYINQFDYFINKKALGQTGNLLIYLHYFILFGVILATVALRVLDEPNSNSTITVIRLYAGILLFFSGLLLGTQYDFAAVTSLRQLGVICFIASFTIALTICLIFPKPLPVAGTTEAFLLINAAVVVKMFSAVKRSQPKLS